MSARYKRIWVNGKEMEEHRYVMEQYLGRKLLPTELVHHINGDRFDNRIENLQVVSAKEHNEIHHPRKYPEVRICAICGKEFVPAYFGNSYPVTCSKECRYKLSSQKQKKKPVIQYDLNGNFIRLWESAMEAYRTTGISFKEISACCHHHTKKARGFKWEFAEGEESQ